MGMQAHRALAKSSVLPDILATNKLCRSESIVRYSLSREIRNASIRAIGPVVFRYRASEPGLRGDDCGACGIMVTLLNLAR